MGGVASEGVGLTLPQWGPTASGQQHCQEWGAGAPEEATARVGRSKVRGESWPVRSQRRRGGGGGKMETCVPLVKPLGLAN